METESGVLAAIRSDIVDAIGRDWSSGALKELQHYLERFPGHEELVAREYLETKQTQDSSAEASPSRATGGEEPHFFGPEPRPSPPDIDSGSRQERIRMLSQPIRRGARYSKEATVGSGGMGVVYRVRDLELDRILALKEMRGDTSQGSSLHAARFLEEAQVTAQLDHPGIVPVHEVGVDEEGRLFFAMKLVRGRELRTILDQLERGEGGWSLPRVLTILLKVCDAMSYSHSKGAIHRDLKPSNIMVGHFGEVFVMDWGLARVVGRPDLHDLRIQNVPHSASLQTARRQEHESDDPSPLLTMDGEAVGTPSYMSPEQAAGDLEKLSPRSDVYSVGAILYHALTGQAPFVPPEAKVPALSILWRLIEGAPTPIAELRPGLPVELVAICEKAMARDPGERYPDMGALAKDLSAFLEQRVVEAYEAGAWAEARKWVRRNKPLAATLATAVVLALVALSGMGYVQAHGREVAERESERADAKAQEAERNLALAQKEQRRAETQTSKVLRLSDAKVLQELEAEADKLWPAHPDRISALESWMSRAHELTSNLAVHRATLLEMRARVRLASEKDRARESAGDGVENPGTEVAALPAEIDARQAWIFDSSEDQWQHDTLWQLIQDLERLESSLLSLEAVTADHGWSVPKRLAFARNLETGFGPGGEHARLWLDALDAIDEAYPGLGLTPQLALIPLGPDPISGLWEFAHLETGEPAVRGTDGNLILTEETGLVFALLPGGTFQMGAQRSDPNGPNYDPEAVNDEGPVRSVTLSAFFISKYEMTQGQWLRFIGENPSQYQPPHPLATSLLHPVEQVSWDDCMELCRRLGLALPSEAQWEYAARGGTGTVWWTGNDRDMLEGAANLADRAAERQDTHWPDAKDWPELDDGSALHAPVNGYDANPFGLHNVHGNVFEWCIDGYADYVANPPPDPVAKLPDIPLRINRGGSFSNAARVARSASRLVSTKSFAVNLLGLRPARSIER